MVRRVDPVERLIDDVCAAGASSDSARAIVDKLRSAGLKVGEMRAWLLNLNRGYPVWTPRWAWQQPAINALDDGYDDLVLEAARRFAAGTPDERVVARAAGCDIESAARLTGGDPARAAVMVEVVKALRASLTETQIRDCFYAEDPQRDSRRLLDDLYEGQEREVLTRLRQGDLDPKQLLLDGLQRLSYVPGGLQSNPYHAEQPQ
jgi:hypothetical protein